MSNSTRSAIRKSVSTIIPPRRATLPPQQFPAGPSSCSIRYASKKSSSTPSSSSSSSSSTISDDWQLPKIDIRQTHPWRYKAHYDNVLAEDLLYMTYDHNAAVQHQQQQSSSGLNNASSSSSAVEPTRTPTPYELNRPASAPKGNRPIKPTTKHLVSQSSIPHLLPRLKSITIHTMVKESIGNKPALLNAIASIRAISGVTEMGLGNPNNEGVQIVKSKKGAAAFKLRAGMPVAVKVTLKGEKMYTFLQTLLEFVLPRIRILPVLPLPSPSSNTASPSALSGVVSFGFGPEAMALFPQIEGNLEAYGRLGGFHVYVETGGRGRGAQDGGRRLLSGFRVPFGRA